MYAPYSINGRYKTAVAHRMYHSTCIPMAHNNQTENQDKVSFTIAEQNGTGNRVYDGPDLCNWNSTVILYTLQPEDHSSNYKQVYLPRIWRASGTPSCSLPLSIMFEAFRYRCKEKVSCCSNRVNYFLQIMIELTQLQNRVLTFWKFPVHEPSKDWNVQMASGEVHEIT